MNLPDVNLPSNRKFGFFFTVIFFFLGFYFLFIDHFPGAIGFISLGASLLAITIIKDALLLPFNKLWMRFGLVLGKIVNPIVMGIIFFGLFTPIAIFTLMFGRDELRINKRKLDSFWRVKSLDSKNNHSFKNQF